MNWLVLIKIKFQCLTIFFCWKEILVFGNLLQSLSGAVMVVWIPLRQGVLDKTLCDKVCQWLAAGTCRWFSPGTKTHCHNIDEILLKGALNTIQSLSGIIGKSGLDNIFDKGHWKIIIGFP